MWNVRDDEGSVLHMLHKAEQVNVWISVLLRNGSNIPCIYIVAFVWMSIELGDNEKPLGFNEQIKEWKWWQCKGAGENRILLKLNNNPLLQHHFSFKMLIVYKCKLKNFTQMTRIIQLKDIVRYIHIVIIIIVAFHLNACEKVRTEIFGMRADNGNEQSARTPYSLSILLRNYLDFQFQVQFYGNVLIRMASLAFNYSA